MRRALALVALLALAGCRIGDYRVGDRTFLDHAFADRKAPFTKGVTTASDVAAALGPPDEVRDPRQNDEMWFIYRFRDVSQYSITLTYYLDVVRWLRDETTDKALLVAFDKDDRVLYWALQEGTGSDAPR